jgi:hypothetical protein
MTGHDKQKSQAYRHQAYMGEVRLMELLVDKEQDEARMKKESLMKGN